MKLHWSPRSPFVRKVLVAAHELGIADRITKTRTAVAMTKPAVSLLPDNPLGKIPTLVLNDGTILYDSLVIVEYFDTLGERQLIPPSGMARVQELRRHALVNGFLDMLILWRNERDRVQPSAELIAAFTLKSDAVLPRLEAEVEALAEGPISLGKITLAVAGAYMDFRFPDLGWRERCPSFDAWQRRFAQRPSMRATEIGEG
jgi:glutathione S-transferase